jgi:hypothetical protein
MIGDLPGAVLRARHITAELMFSPCRNHYGFTGAGTSFLIGMD